MSNLSNAVGRIAASLSVIARCCENMNRAATEQSQQQPSELRWRSISERVPPEGVDVLLWGFTCDGVEVHVGRRDGEHYSRLTLSHGEFVMRPTWWMHVPRAGLLAWELDMMRNCKGLMRFV